MMMSTASCEENCFLRADPAKRGLCVSGAQIGHTNQPLIIKGTFGCNVQAGIKITLAGFFVINGKGITLIDKETAIILGMLKIGINFAVIAETPQVLRQQYPAVFSGLGKLNTKQVYGKEVAMPLRTASCLTAFFADLGYVFVEG